ncbi:MAG: hypothetical protein MZU91_14365 [Desulfosudis oleivorans]|nr:hypothetical protein [Desulfosudis oleivorans]
MIGGWILPRPPTPCCSRSRPPSPWPGFSARRACPCRRRTPTAGIATVPARAVSSVNEHTRESAAGC